MSYNLGMKQQQSQKQSQLLMVLPKMKQAMACMQAPILELNALIENEMEQNPLLEIEEEESKEEEEVAESKEEKELTLKEDDFGVMNELDEAFWDHFAESGSLNNVRSADDEKRQNYLETTLQRCETLFEHLKEQVNETFEADLEREIAEAIIGSLDGRGFLQESVKELSLFCHCEESQVEEVLKTIQQFDPPGVAARSTDEALLLQLKRLGKEKSLAYLIVDECYQDLIHNRIPMIKKHLGKSEKEIERAISDDLAPLDLRPGVGWESGPVQYITPDILIIEEDGKVRIELNDEPLPNLRISRRYLKMLGQEGLSEEEKKYIKQKVLSAKWLIRNLDQRNNTLTRIAKYLLDKQKAFFREAGGKLEPLVMREVADALELHESTIARAVANKYMDTPRGLLAMRSFFTHKYVTEKGESLSSKTVQDALQRLIDGESKKNPLSDEKLSKELKAQGYPCARRTVAKYRTALGIGNTTERKRFS